MTQGRTGALLINLGTPRSPEVSDVRRYLREFLSDPDVLDFPAPLRRALLEMFILPFRPRRAARAYALIWTAEGSPLLVHGRGLRDGVATELGDGYQVELAMRYGEPSIGSALRRLASGNLDRIVALPLFPQYATAATGSALTELARQQAQISGLPVVEIRGSFCTDRRFIAAFGSVARPRLEDFDPDFTLFSFHGLPERQVRKTDLEGHGCLDRSDCCDALTGSNRDCYRGQCFATGRALAEQLALDADRWAVSFQSRMGPVRWIRPYTDKLLPKLRQRGVRRLAVMCPAFVADCLETVEEIGIRARDQWCDLGGSELLLVPSLNTEPAWISTVSGLIRGD